MQPQEQRDSDRAQTEAKPADAAVDLNLTDSALDGASSDGGPAGAPSLTIGHIGRYALKQQLGEGGLGTVYAAYDPILSRTIAVKTLHLSVAEGDRATLDALFLNEARAAAGLNHPNIVTVYDAGLSEQGVYIAMERLRGRDLRQLLANGWRPDIVQAAQILRRVSDALSYAHSKGVIHCDIKPANIFMVGRTLPKVVDFGIARVAHGQDIPALEGVVAGSPHYLAPEQLRGETVDRRCDVYALGVVMYELLTHRKAFDGKSLAEIVHAVDHVRPPSPHEVRPEVPVALSDITMRALAHDPAQRYRSARQMSQALREWLETEAEIAGDEASPQRGNKRRVLVATLLAGAAHRRRGGLAADVRARSRRAVAHAATAAGCRSGSGAGRDAGGHQARRQLALQHGAAGEAIAAVVAPAPRAHQAGRTTGRCATRARRVSPARAPRPSRRGRRPPAWFNSRSRRGARSRSMAKAPASRRPCRSSRCRWAST